MIWLAIALLFAAACVAVGTRRLFAGRTRDLDEQQARAQIAEWDATTQKYVQDPIRDLSERHEALLRDLHKEGAE